jgi:hypothetical protein
VLCSRRTRKPSTAVDPSSRAAVVAPRVRCVREGSHQCGVVRGGVGRVAVAMADVVAFQTPSRVRRRRRIAVPGRAIDADDQPHLVVIDWSAKGELKVDIDATSAVSGSKMRSPPLRAGVILAMLRLLPWSSLPPQRRARRLGLETRQRQASLWAESTGAAWGNARRWGSDRAGASARAVHERWRSSPPPSFSPRSTLP